MMRYVNIIIIILYPQFCSSFTFYKTTFSRSLRFFSSTQREEESQQRNLDYVLDVARNASLAAGEVMLESLQSIESLNVKTKANSQDIVTESDVRCQEIIRDSILSHFPQDQFLGEEDVDCGTAASIKALSDVILDEQSNDAMLWIVDPIDGTTNFQAGKLVYIRFPSSLSLISLFGPPIQRFLNNICNRASSVLCKYWCLFFCHKRS